MIRPPPEDCAPAKNILSRQTRSDHFLVFEAAPAADCKLDFFGWRHPFTGRSQVDVSISPRIVSLRAVGTFAREVFAGPVDAD